MSDSNSDIPEEVLAHYEKHGCEHPECKIPNLLILAQYFASMKEHERINAVRMMLVCISAPAGHTNNLLDEPSEGRKRARKSIGAEKNCTTTFCLRGKSVCREEFAAVLQVSPKTIERHAQDVTSKDGISIYRPDRK